MFTQPNQWMDESHALAIAEKLEEAGMTKDELIVLLTSPGNRLAQKFVSLMRRDRGMFDESLDQRNARMILDCDYISPAEVEPFFGNYTPDQKELLWHIPFKRETLQKLKGTHVLVPGFPLTIQELSRRDDIQKRMDSYKCKAYWESIWRMFLFDEPTPQLRLPSVIPTLISTLTHYPIDVQYVQQRVNLQWYLMPKNLMPLQEDQRMPRMCDVVYVTSLYSLINSNRLFLGWICCEGWQCISNDAQRGFQHYCAAGHIRKHLTVPMVPFDLE